MCYEQLLILANFINILSYSCDENSKIGYKLLAIKKFILKMLIKVAKKYQ